MFCYESAAYRKRVDCRVEEVCCFFIVAGRFVGNEQEVESVAEREETVYCSCLLASSIEG